MQVDVQAEQLSEHASLDRSKPRLGVLFVHGIGEQNRGDTLLHAGGAVYRWLNRWLQFPNLSIAGNPIPSDPVRIVSQSIEQESAPAHALVEFKLEIEPDQIRRTQWLMAECWWASSFVSVKFSEVARWMLNTAPVLIVANTANFFARRSQKGRFFFAAASLSLSVPTALATWLVVGMLSVLALIPIDAVRAWLGRFLLIVTGWLGDAFVYTHRPLETAGATSKVRRDLDWLSDRCDCIAVVAHSQGAAITYDALKDSLPTSPNLYITLGQGLSKLAGLRPSPSGSGAPVAARWTNFSLITFSLGVIVSIWIMPWTALLQGAWMALLLQILGGFGALSLVMDAYLGETGTIRVYGLRTGGETRWVDYFASADLVPNGPVNDREFSEDVNSVEVYNYRSVFLDHTSYWQNPTFVASVVYELDNIIQTGLAEVRERGWNRDNWLAKIREARKRRTLLLHLLRIANLVSASVALLYLDLASVGAPIYAFLGKSSLISWFSQLLGQELMTATFGSGLVVLLTLAIYRVGLSSWNMLEQRASATDVFAEPTVKLLLNRGIFAATLVFPILFVVLVTNWTEAEQLWARFGNDLIMIGNAVAIVVITLICIQVYRSLRRPARMIEFKPRR